MLRLKHKRTGEVRDVEKDSPEHRALLDEVVDDGGGHSESGWKELGEFDPFHRQSGQALGQVDLSGVGPEKHPERNLTQAEIDAGITSWEEKQSQLLSQSTAVRPAAETYGETGVEEDGVVEEEDAPEGYAEETKENLKALCDQRGIQYTSKETKDELISKLEAHDAGDLNTEEEETGDQDNDDQEVTADAG